MPRLNPTLITYVLLPLLVTVVGGVVVDLFSKTAHPTPSTETNPTFVPVLHDTCCNNFPTIVLPPYPEIELEPTPTQENTPITEIKESPKIVDKEIFSKPGVPKTQSIPVVVSRAKFEAKIYVNDKWELNAPNTIELPYGLHTIRVEKDGEEYETRIKIPTTRSQILIEDHYFKTY